MTLYPSKYWLEPRGEYEELQKRMTEHGWIFPFIPEPLRPKLMQYDRQSLWSTSKETDPYDIYQLFYYHDPSRPIGYLQPGREDFFMMGVAGRTAAFHGILARFGPLFIAQSTSWWGVEIHPDRSRVKKLANRYNDVWNSTALALQPFAHEELCVAVVNSEPRGYSQIWRKVPEGSVAKNPITKFGPLRFETDPHEELLSWDIIEGGQKESFESRLQKLVDGPDEIVAIAARHLLSVPRHWT
jgi:hypothetical protein